MSPKAGCLLLGGKKDTRGNTGCRMGKHLHIKKHIVCLSFSAHVLVQIPHTTMQCTPRGCQCLNCLNMYTISKTGSLPHSLVTQPPSRQEARPETLTRHHHPQPHPHPSSGKQDKMDPEVAYRVHVVVAE